MSKIVPQNPTTINIDHFNHENDQAIHLKECRICLQESLPLIIACNCTGTVKYVHEQCLKLWANEVIKKKLKEQEDEGQEDIIESIQCELCKQNIKLKVEWNTVKLTFEEAKSRNQDYFWSIFGINVFIALICLGCILFSLITMIMVLMKDPTVDYQKFINDPLLSWGTLSIALGAGIIFLIKALRDLQIMFVRKQFQVYGVVAKETIGQQNARLHQFDSNFNNPRSINYFNIKMEASDSNLNTAFNFNNKRVTPSTQNDSQTNQEILFPNRSSLGFKHFQKLPPLSKFIPSS